MLSRPGTVCICVCIFTLCLSFLLLMHNAEFFNQCLVHLKILPDSHFFLFMWKLYYLARVPFIFQSCENCIICWKPGSLEGSDANISINGGSKTDDSVSILHRFDYRECEIWYMRFCLDYQQKVCLTHNICFQFDCCFILRIRNVLTNKKL